MYVQEMQHTKQYLINQLRLHSINIILKYRQEKICLIMNTSWDVSQSILQNLVQQLL